MYKKNEKILLQWSFLSELILFIGSYEYKMVFCILKCTEGYTLLNLKLSKIIFNLILFLIFNVRIVIRNAANSKTPFAVVNDMSPLSCWQRPALKPRIVYFSE